MPFIACIVVFLPRIQFLSVLNRTLAVRFGTRISWAGYKQYLVYLIAGHFHTNQLYLLKSVFKPLKAPLNTYWQLWVSLLIGMIFFVAGLFFPNTLIQSLQQSNEWILNQFGSFYLWVAFGIVLFALVIVFLPIGKQTLGNERPQYSYFSWIALLYSTGMGSGLLLRAVQEPVYYLQHSPVAVYPAPLLSLQYTYFHWGFTPWTLYSVFGLVVAFYLYVHKKNNFLEALKMSIGTQRAVGVVVLLILLITVVGVVASLGLGASQLMGGLTALFPITVGSGFLATSILLMGIIATLSALTGIQRVIKWLADMDLVVSLALLLFVACFVNYSLFFKQVGQAMTHYLVHFATMSLAMGDFDPGEAFTREWTVFYWAFWLAWVPFTGLFIARISQGRSIREFLVATILVPTLATILWFSVFGHVSFALISHPQDDRFNNVFTSLFVFLQQLPFASITIPVSIGLLLTALINSVDSAIFVLAMFSDGGKENPSRRHKLLWGAVITVTTLGLALAAGNQLLAALSQLLILMALPFTFVYVYVIVRFAGVLWQTGQPTASDDKPEK